MYELERNAVGTQVTVYTETALQAVIRESREEVEFTNAAGEVFEPRYKWIASFDEGVYNFEAFATVIDVNAEIASKEPNKARSSHIGCSIPNAALTQDSFLPPLTPQIR